MRLKQRKFIVRLDIPKGVSIAEMEEYILDAVASFRGALEPDVNLLFDLDPSKITVNISNNKDRGK